MAAKFAYGLGVEKSLTGEEVDVWLQRGCGGAWESLGTTTTTDGVTLHATVDNVIDTGGRVFVQLPVLPVGRHRVAMIVAGDHTSTDLIVEVVPKGAHFFVTSVDGTLTSSTTAELGDVLFGATPEAQPDAAAVVQALVRKGFHPFYLTGRPEPETSRTRAFLEQRGFPRGVVHTSSGLATLLGGPATTFKTGDLGLLQKRGVVLPMALGSDGSDADAYDSARVPASGLLLFQYTDPDHGGRRVDAYKDLLPEIAKLPASCK